MTGPFDGRYPEYDALARSGAPDWDKQTWDAVQARLHQDPAARYLTASEAGTLAAVAERIIPQPDRAASEKIPVVAWIDAKLYHDQRDGYRYDGMPPQREAWRLGIEGIDQAARIVHGRAFVELSGAQQDDILTIIETGSPPGDAWRTVPASLFFTSVLCTTVARAYYSHPTAWSEIGYSGPSSPRGHVRIWIGGVDPWEPHERRTPWKTE